METIKKFEEMLKADTNLALEYQKLTEDKNSETVVNFMKTHGVSDEDIKDLINRELSDDELDGVAGGRTLVRGIYLPESLEQHR
ncbi:MAG: Nif11-like leader peptide family natural product precursor [Campylobacterota bacterium]|nr:Nif11-like leader peptide family natural product precursor [Campylobacterota bacterium]